MIEDEKSPKNRFYLDIVKALAEELHDYIEERRLKHYLPVEFKGFKTLVEMNGIENFTLNKSNPAMYREGRGKPGEKVSYIRFTQQCELKVLYNYVYKKGSQTFLNDRMEGFHFEIFLETPLEDAAMEFSLRILPKGDQKGFDEIWDRIIEPFEKNFYQSLKALDKFPNSKMSYAERMESLDMKDVVALAAAINWRRRDGDKLWIKVPEEIKLLARAGERSGNVINM